MEAHETGWLFGACSPADGDDLAAELGVHRITAEALIRRGYDRADKARTFLEGADPGHDPLSLGDMAVACERILAAIAENRRICIHGDYDADGICATALAVLALREFDANVEWHLPSRFEEGYGLGAGTVERLATSGIGLLITVDCGITAADQVAQAAALGMEVIVTDHHQPGNVLPDCPRVCTRPSEYAFPDLCGTGVVYKLCRALFTAAGKDPAELEQHLDLVAMATVADVVPLIDENRALVRAGLTRLARTTKIGLRALMVSARVDRVNVSASDIGFRLAPRINAAGRLCHPGEALELMLTTEERRARELAARLEQLNRDRQAVEDTILQEAIALVDVASPEWRERHAYVIASQDWHEGVIGIVASRLVERYRRPVVLIAVGDDEAKGSGRSVPGYDLHAGLTSAGDHLLRYGGHKAAAGLTIDASEIPAFAEALARHADGVLGSRPAAMQRHVDAVLAPSEVSLDLIEELSALEPFGLGNPGVTLLAPAATLHGVERMGEGKHLRCTVELGGFRCRAVGFGMGDLGDELSQPGRFDVAYRIQRNEWNGAVTPQMVLRGVVPTPTGRPPAPYDPLSVSDRGLGRARVIDERGHGVQITSIARMAAAAEPVLVLVADVTRRAAMLTGPLDPARFGSGAITLADYAQAAAIGDLAQRYARVVALDPPATSEEGALLAELGSTTTVHLVWGAAEIAFARSVAERREPLREALRVVWKAEKAGAADIPLDPETVARCRAVLGEVGLETGAPGSAKVDLELSPTYREAVARMEAVKRFLASDQIAV